MYNFLSKSMTLVIFSDQHNSNNIPRLTVPAYIRLAGAWAGGTGFIEAQQLNAEPC